MSDSLFNHWIVTQSVQVALLAVLIGAASFFLKSRHPHLVWTLWLLVLIKAMTPPLWHSPISLAVAMRNSQVLYSRGNEIEADPAASKRVFDADPAIRSLPTVDGRPVQLAAK